MSVISNRHSVVPFVAGKTMPLTEQRLARIGYKTTKKQAAKFANIAVSVPAITEFPEDVLDRALPYLVTVFENAQDGIIRSLYESSAGQLKEVSDDDISLSACLAFMEAEANGSRLKKETIEAWFDSEVSDNLTVLIAEKLGFADMNADQEKTVSKHVRIYRDVISMLAGGKTFLQPTQIKGCKVAIALASEDSDIGVKLTARLTAMENKPAVEDLLDIDA